jgi:hypothetical protein
LNDIFFKIQAPRLSSGEVTEKSILQLHRRTEYTPLVLLVGIAGFLAIMTSSGRCVGSSFMPTVAQILPVLFLAQIVDMGFMASRVSDDIGKSPSDMRLASRYMGISASSMLIAFLIGEGAALWGVANGPTTLLVTLPLLMGFLEQSISRSAFPYVVDSGRWRLLRWSSSVDPLSNQTKASEVNRVPRFGTNRSHSCH